MLNKTQTYAPTVWLIIELHQSFHRLISYLLPSLGSYWYLAAYFEIHPKPSSEKWNDSSRSLTFIASKIKIDGFWFWRLWCSNFDEYFWLESRKTSKTTLTTFDIVDLQQYCRPTTTSTKHCWKMCHECKQTMRMFFESEDV